MPSSSWSTIGFWPSLPVMLLAVTPIVVLLVDLVVPQRRSGLSLFLSLVGMGAAAVILADCIPEQGSTAFNGFLQYDALGRLGAIVALAAGCLVAIISPRTVRLYDLPPAEYYALLVISVLGMVTLCVSVELLTMFLAVEIIAVAMYILVGLPQRSTQSSEAALKYFILGSFSSAFLIFGFAFLYGSAGGNTLLVRIGDPVDFVHHPWCLGCLALGLALAIAGFAFKVTLVPFHLYAADVYQGAPTPVAALLATGSKVAGFIALLHLLVPPAGAGKRALTELSVDVVQLLWLLAALSIIVGNVVGLLQHNIKRMLAYSSIAHSGYLLVGVLVLVEGSASGAEVEESILLYLVAYVLMNVTAFGVALTLGRRGENDISDYAGLARQAPGLALAMTVAMIALTGIPATVGFVGKFYVFKAGVEAGFISLVVIAVLGSAISAYYYLRVVVFMYMREPERESSVEPVSFVQALGLALAAVPIVGFGLFPQSLMVLLRII